jgi:hypothetical protein
MDWNQIAVVVKAKCWENVETDLEKTSSVVCIFGRFHFGVCIKKIRKPVGKGE